MCREGERCGGKKGGKCEEREGTRAVSHSTVLFEFISGLLGPGGVWKQSQIIIMHKAVNFFCEEKAK